MLLSLIAKGTIVTSLSFERFLCHHSKGSISLTAFVYVEMLPFNSLAMSEVGRWMSNVFTRASSPPREFPNSGFEVISDVEKLEEENWEWYKPGLFYPVRIGEVFQSRYQVLGKLGYGSRSTVWLCRDLTWVWQCIQACKVLSIHTRGHKYMTLKVCEQDSPTIRRELAAYKHLDTVTTRKPGVSLVRKLLDSFKATGPAGEHQCLVHEPLGMSMETLREISPAGKIPEALLKAFLKHLLQALDFLHTDAKMIHAGIEHLLELVALDVLPRSTGHVLTSSLPDLQARNIHLGIEEDSILKEFEAAELRTPSPRKIDGDQVIYECRGLRLPTKFGRPILCDFGEARFGKQTYTDDIQPYVYRAPEIILDIPWTYSVDIWNVGVVVS